MNKFELEIVHYFDREGSVAEIYYDFNQWAEVSMRNGKVIIEFYPHPQEKYWEFPYEEGIQVLQKARNRIVKGENKENIFFEKIKIDPQQVNEQAEKILEGILNHPEKKIVQGKLERFGDVVDIYAPDMGGARYTANGEFIGFLEC